jgi:hypothetical protein
MTPLQQEPVARRAKNPERLRAENTELVVDAAVPESARPPADVPRQCSGLNVAQLRPRRAGGVDWVGSNDRTVRTPATTADCGSGTQANARHPQPGSLPRRRRFR